MFCIAAFIVLLFLAAFSAKYRGYLKTAWGCTFRRITLRACDTSFKDEVKNRLLAKVAVRKPGLVRAADIGLEVGAIIVVLATVWSLYIVVKGGVNYFVYDTCYPSNASACSLGAEACSIGTARISFSQSLIEFKPQQWFMEEFNEVSETISDIPARLQTWKAEEYLPANATYFKPYQADKPTAVEVIDPGCRFCRSLNDNIIEANFYDTYNLSYILYPIHEKDSYKFPHSRLITARLEAMKMTPLDGAEISADWQVLEKIFTGKDSKGSNYQDVINTVLNQTQVEDLLSQWMREIGYSDSQIIAIRKLAHSDEVDALIVQHAELVEQEIRTKKIPTLIFDGRRHGGAINVDQLR